MALSNHKLVIGLFIILAVGMAQAEGTQKSLFKSGEKTICGPVDDRIPSTNPKIGRVLERTAPAGCTVTLIGRSCVVTAGHCLSTFQIAEFNTLPSQNGRITRSDSKDIYEVDRATIVSRDAGPGNDFAVFRLKKNSITGQYPGDVQGFYKVASEKAKVGDEVRITGYGADRSEGDRNYAQQTHSGTISAISGPLMKHVVDTMGGNSGSTVILEETEEVIGIHTHGGCGETSGANSSTFILGHTDVQAAIKNCLTGEEELN